MWGRKRGREAERERGREGEREGEREREKNRKGGRGRERDVVCVTSEAERFCRVLWLADWRPRNSDHARGSESEGLRGGAADDAYPNLRAEKVRRHVPAQTRRQEKRWQIHLLLPFLLFRPLRMGWCPPT